MNYVVQIIKNEREKKGISQRQLGLKAGCSGRAIAYWESGQREISLKMADKLLEVLDISVLIGTL